MVLGLSLGLKFSCIEYALSILFGIIRKIVGNLHKIDVFLPQIYFIHLASLLHAYNGYLWHIPATSWLSEDISEWMCRICHITRACLGIGRSSFPTKFGSVRAFRIWNWTLQDKRTWIRNFRLICEHELLRLVGFGFVIFFLVAFFVYDHDFYTKLSIPCAIGDKHHATHSANLIE